MSTEDLISLEEAQALLGVGRATLFNLVKRYDVPRYRIPAQGRRTFLRREDVQRLREPQRVEPQQGKRAA